MKKALSLILACAVLTSALVGCQPEEVEETDNSASNEISNEISSEISSETSIEEQTVSETESEPEEEAEYYQYPSSENEFVLDPKTIGEFFPYDSTLDEIVELHKKLLGEEKLKDNMFVSAFQESGRQQIIYKNCRLYDMSGVLIIWFHDDGLLGDIRFYSPNHTIGEYEYLLFDLTNYFNRDNPNYHANLYTLGYHPSFRENSDIAKVYTKELIPMGYSSGEVYVEDENIKSFTATIHLPNETNIKDFYGFPFPYCEDKEIANEIYVGFYPKSDSPNRA